MVRAAVLLILGLGSIAAAYMVLARDEPRRDPPSPGPAASADSAPAPAGPAIAELRPGVAPAAPLLVEEPARAVRDVTPPGITAGPLVTGTITRIPPPPPPPMEQAPDPKARMQRLFRPVAVTAGILQSGDRQIRLAAVEAPEAEATCGEGSAAWPCGRMARAALRRFLRGRAIECEVPAGAPDIPDPARCAIAGEDLSAWLVAQGWAKRSGDSYAEIEAAAREAKRGLWSDGRPDYRPDLAAAGG